MKRAAFILVAALAVLLVYPATMPSAKSPGIADSPTIHAITPDLGPPPIAGGPDGSGDDDEGDGDDVSGIRDGTRPLGDATVMAFFGPKSVGARVWWMYLLFHRVL